MSCPSWGARARPGRGLGWPPEGPDENVRGRNPPDASDATPQHTHGCDTGRDGGEFLDRFPGGGVHLLHLRDQRLGRIGEEEILQVVMDMGRLAARGVSRDVMAGDGKGDFRGAVARGQDEV